MRRIELIKGGQVIETHTEHSTIDPAELRKIAERLASQSEAKPDDWVVKVEIGCKIVWRNR
jgi:hypothetical protein